MKIVAFIFARGGSKGLPKKNLLKINNITLIGHSINIAKKLVSPENIFLSTDNDEIAEVGIKSGAQIINRPLELAQDNSSEWLAWQHAINWVIKHRGDFDIFLSLPATAPLRIMQDVENCITKFIKNKQSDLLITVSKSRKSPWFNMVKINEDESVELISTGKNMPYRRQDAPQTFDVTTVAYVASPNFIMNNSRIWDGNIISQEIPPERAVDIDDFLDYEFAKFLFQKNK